MPSSFGRPTIVADVERVGRCRWRASRDAPTKTSNRHRGPARPEPSRALPAELPDFARRPGAGASSPAPGKPLAMSVLLGLVLLAAACGPPRPLTPQASYDYFCARCHGDDGTGDPRTVGLNPKLDLVASDMIKSRDREAIRKRVLQGEGAMPGFQEKLEPHEVDDLVAYTLERFGPSAPVEGMDETDPAGP